MKTLAPDTGDRAGAHDLHRAAEGTYQVAKPAGDDGVSCPAAGSPRRQRQRSRRLRVRPPRLRRP